jgi:hypothetical protein
MTYFWKKNEGIYHWHLECSSIPIQVRGNPDWVVSEERPLGKDICLQCREKDLATRLKKGMY